MKLQKSQKTYVPTEKNLEKSWYILDVKDKPLGRTATKIADVLRGKTKTWFSPQLDCGDFVVVVNASHIKLAGNKMESKTYHWHTRYGGGFRTRTARQLLEKKPEKILFDAVWGMMPRNKLRNSIMKKLRIFPLEAHEHTAQAPKPITL